MARDSEDCSGGHSSEHARPLQGAPRCHRCCDVIGMYEPIVALTEGEPLHTSGSAAADQLAAGRPCFHLACFSSASSPAVG